ncbi:hypothetical protein [Streptomyces sp. NPDC004042]|uniref:hypothetical protein n=1 Tax=Streptomyces sp. NPDC004042 TaxID=3154451 RepID=UPI0033B9A984
MTQSGQGEEPSARPAREGIVLPSDGGQPLLPGTTGGPGGRPPAQSAGPGPAQPPAGGQSWGQPWGPEGEQRPQSGQDWQAPPTQTWGAAPSYPQAPSGQWDAHGGPGGHPGAGPLPPEGAPAPGHGTHGGAPQPPYQQHQGYPQDHGPQGQVPQQHQGFQQHQQHQAPPQHPHQHQHQAAPLPPAAGPGPYGTSAGVPLPPPADEGATQFLPPVAAGSADEGATQFLPPVPAAPVDEGATQYIPPVPSGGLPPAVPGAGPDAEATQYIAPVPGGPGGAPAPPFGAGPGAGGGRQTPAEFDNLFRDGSGGTAPGTQQLPHLQPRDGRSGPGLRTGGAPVNLGQPPAQTFQPGPGGPAGPPYAGGPDSPDGGGRRPRSRMPLIAAVGVGIVALGVGAGALLSGGGGSDDKTDKAANVSSAAPATGGASSAPAAPDPAREQAVALDKLLADSGGSRASVIKAVDDVKKCDDLSAAAADLRSAAKQRAALVTRLGALPVDKLPQHAELTAALTSAWKASQSADQHYAAWADQARGKKGCDKGHARNTSHTQAANHQSGVASVQKAKAAKLWNAIARKYGLTERQPTQL